MQTEPPEASPLKRKRRWFQFSLRTLLIFTTIAALGSGWFRAKTMRIQKQRAAIEAIEKSGGMVLYDYQVDSLGGIVPNAKPPVVSWPWTLFGRDCFLPVAEAVIRSDNEINLTRRTQRTPGLAPQRLCCRRLGSEPRHRDPTSINRRWISDHRRLKPAQGTRPAVYRSRRYRNQTHRKIETAAIIGTLRH